VNKLIYDAREEEGAREREGLWEFLVDRASRPLIMGLEAAQEAWYLWATGIVSAGVGPVVPRNESRTSREDSLQQELTDFLLISLVC